MLDFKKKNYRSYISYLIKIFPTGNLYRYVGFFPVENKDFRLKLKFLWDFYFKPYRDIKLILTYFIV